MFLNKTLGGKPGTLVQTRADLRDLTRAGQGLASTSTVKCAFQPTSREAPTPPRAYMYVYVFTRGGDRHSVTNRCHIRQVKSIFAAD